MENVPLRARIAMLWVFIAFVLVARQMVFGFEMLAAGEYSLPPAPIFSLWGVGATLVLFAIPFFCLTLKDRSNRWLNVALGLFFTVAGIAGTAFEIPQLTASNAHIFLMDAAATVSPAVILYYAYRWPKE